MKKLICFLMCAFCLLGCSALASDVVEYSIPEISCVVNLDDSWLCVTRHTEDIDLSGTAYNYAGMYQIVDQISEQLTQERFQDLHCYLVNYSDGLLLECHILAITTTESVEMWDFSLVNNSLLRDSHYEDVIDGAEFFEMYTSIHGDVYVGIDSTTAYAQDSDRSLTYFTVNNGRAIQVQVASGYPSEEHDLTQRIHELLDGIAFTNKAPKPTSVSDTVQETMVSEAINESDRNFLSSILDAVKSVVMWFVYDYLQMTNTGIIITVIVVIFVAFSWVFSRIFKR